MNRQSSGWTKGSRLVISYEMTPFIIYDLNPNRFDSAHMNKYLKK